MDDFYDPDLEARLYAEIHYTNDTYELPKADPRREITEGDAAPGTIRSYAKKTGMFPKKHRALIDGVRVPGSHRFQEPITGTGGRQDFRSNQSDSTRSIPPLFDFDRSNSSDPARFNSPNLSRFNSPNPPRFNLLGPGRYNPPDLYNSRSNILDIRPNELDRSRVQSIMYNRHSNYQMNPFASDEFNQNLIDPYSNHGQDFSRFNQQDFIRLNRSTPNKSKGQVRKDTHMANLKKFSKKVRDQRRREKTKKNRKTGRRSIGPGNSSTPRKNPNRAARNPEINKSIDGIKDIVNLDDSIEIIEIEESTDDNLAQSDLGSQTSNCQDKSNDNLDKSDDNLDRSEHILSKSNENLDKSNHNLDKSNENLDKSSRNFDKSNNVELLNKNLDKSNENLDKSKNLATPNKNSDKSNKNLDKSNKNLDKSNKNLDKSKSSETPNKNLDKSNKNLDKFNKDLDKSDHNLNKSKTVETPNKNLDKSNKNLEKPNHNLDKSKNSETLIKNLDKFNKILDKSNKNLEKPNHNLDKSKNSETLIKNLDKFNKTLDKSNKNLDKSNHHLDKSKTLDKSNKNLEKSDHNLDKSKNLETPNKNLDKSDQNNDKSSDNLERSNENNNLTDNQVNIIESSSETSDSQNSSAESLINNEKNDNNSKYNIKSSPKNNSTKKLDSSSDSESESDESIFEVPVPPKPAPPLINLNDSDESDDSDSEEDSSDLISKDNIVQEEEEEEEEETEVETDKEGFVTIDTWVTDNSNSSKGENSSSSASKNSEKQIWDCDDDEDDDDEKEEEEMEEEIIETNIVLNCSQVQKSVSTLEELKNVGCESSNLISDDNMPESEEISISTDDNELNNSSMTLNVSENNSDKTSKSGSKNPSSEKKRSRDESRNRDDCLKPIKIPRNENESTSFEEYISKPMPEPLKSFYLETRVTRCMNDVRDIQSQMSRDPNRWAILDADLVRQRNDRRLRCSYCHQPGHKREKCPDKKKSATCYMCGTEGHHESRCPQKMCLTCGTKYSSYRKTCEYCRKLHCALCKSVGHLKNNCPDLWRRYHDTTTPDAIIIPPEHQNAWKPYYQLSCCNCTRRGHDSSTCNRYRWSPHFPSPIFVTNYTDGPTYPPRILTEQSIPQASSPLQNGTIYHYRSYKNSKHQNWSSEIIYPHEIPNITYTFETTGQERPVFLITHFPVEYSYPIDVHIKRIVPNKLQVELKTPTSQSTFELKKLMIQWMSRRSLDRKNITLTSRLPTTKAALFNALLKKLYKFINLTSFKGLTNYDEKFLSQKSSEALQARVQKIKNRGGKLKLNIPRILEEIEQRYLLELVSSLYNFNLAPSAKAILNDFLKLLELLSTDGAWEGDTGERSEVPQWIYMSCCWFNFELFTVHLSDYIVESKNMFLEHLNKLRERNMSKMRLLQELDLKMIITKAVRNKFRTDKSIEQILDKKKGKRMILENNRTQKSNSNKASNNNSNSSSKKNKNDQGKKPIEKSLIIDGKINQEVLQREKLVCRAQAAVDMAKKHGLKSFVEQAEVMVKKIKDGGMIRKNAIEQLWTNMVKELRGNNISDQS